MLMVFVYLWRGQKQKAREEVARIGGQLAQENPGVNRGQSLGLYSQVGFNIADDPEAFAGAMLFLFIGALVLGIMLGHARVHRACLLRKI